MWSALASNGLCCHGIVHSLVTSAQYQIALWSEGVCPAPCTNLHIGHRGLPQMTSVRVLENAASDEMTRLRMQMTHHGCLRVGRDQTCLQKTKRYKN